MIHLLSKFLALPAYPVGLAFLLGLFALISAIKNWRRTLLTALSLSILILWIFSMPPVSHFLVRSLEKKYNPLKTCPGAPVIALLGGAGQAPRPPRLHDETNLFADRIIYAARLFKQGCAPFILTSGGKLGFVAEFEGSEALINARILRENFGIDSAHILLEQQAKNTHDHPRLIAPILDSIGGEKKVIIVTSAMHMFRSVRVFQKAGFTVIPAPTDYFAGEKFQWGLIKLFPNANTLELSTIALHEYYGLLAYKLLGWI